MSEKIKIGSSGNWGVKPNGLLGYNDENNIFKAIELSSSRASSGTYVAQSGLIADAEVGVPRIDWTNGVGELLLEPQSTNLITYSEDFSNVFWTLSGASVVSGQSSPNGATDAYKLTEDSATSTHFIYSNNINTGAGGSTISIRVKADGRNWVYLYDTEQLEGAYFDIANGVVGTLTGSPDATSIKSLANGWYEISLTTTSTTRVDFQLYLADADGSNSYSGDGTSGVLIYGAQVEFLSYPTSYIRTEGSTVTRIADAVTGNSSLGQVINSSEGVLYFELKTSAFASNQQIALTDGTTNERIILEVRDNGTTLRYNVRSGGLNNVEIDASISVGTYYKVALMYSSSEAKFYLNGTEEGSDASVTTPSGLNELSFNGSTGSLNFYGKIKDLRVYDTALTDAELTTLTTL